MKIDFSSQYVYCNVHFFDSKKKLGLREDELSVLDARKDNVNINNNMSDSLYNVHTMTMTEGR